MMCVGRRALGALRRRPPVSRIDPPADLEPTLDPPLYLSRRLSQHAPPIAAHHRYRFLALVNHRVATRRTQPHAARG